MDRMRQKGDALAGSFFSPPLVPLLEFGIRQIGQVLLKSHQALLVLHNGNKKANYFQKSIKMELRGWA